MPIQQIIRKAITDHLVNHVNVGDDKRCRIDILCEQAEREIMKEMQTKDLPSELLVAAIQNKKQNTMTPTKGTNLIAKEPNNIFGKNSLVVGKEYPIKEIRVHSELIVIESEIFSDHYFGLVESEPNYWGNYFEIKTITP